MEQNNEKEIIIIVGVDTLGGIGRNNDLPWPNIPTDKKFFARETQDGTLLMGPKTYFSIPEQYRSLPGRHKIVVTRNQGNIIYPDDVILVGSIAEGIAKSPTKKVFLSGGAGIYQEGMQFAQKMLITRIFWHNQIPCDVFFPVITPEWRLIPTGPKILDEKSRIEIQFETWINTKNPPPLTE